MTGVASANVPFPLCFATTMQVPLATVSMLNALVAFIVQIPVVEDVSVTVRPDDAVAPDTNVSPLILAPGFEKVIV